MVTDSLHAHAQSRRALCCHYAEYREERIANSNLLLREILTKQSRMWQRSISIMEKEFQVLLPRVCCRELKVKRTRQF